MGALRFLANLLTFGAFVKHIESNAKAASTYRAASWQRLPVEDNPQQLAADVENWLEEGHSPAEIYKHTRPKVRAITTSEVREIVNGADDSDYYDALAKYLFEQEQK